MFTRALLRPVYEALPFRAMSDLSAEQKALNSILSRLDVQRDGEDRFVGRSQRMGPPRIFGGLVAGQAVVAAARTISGLSPHSLHAYFLAPGRPEESIEYRVDRIKEGRNFHARQVTASQGPRVIFSMTASFTRPERGISHQDPMPDAPDPESLKPRRSGFGPMVWPVESRECDPSFREAAERGQRLMWIRPSAPLPEDPALHVGLIVFASDMSLVMTGALPHRELRRRPRGGASLDHTMWFHQMTPFDDWMLYTMNTPAAHGGRPLIHGAMYRRDGTRVVSVAQEGLIRS